MSFAGLHRFSLVGFFLVAVACTSTGAVEDFAIIAKPQVLIYGASGRLGSHIVDEALIRGYQVTGVTRSPERLNHRAQEIEIVVSDYWIERQPAS